MEYKSATKNIVLYVWITLMFVGAFYNFPMGSVVIGFFPIVYFVLSTTRVDVRDFFWICFFGLFILLKSMNLSGYHAISQYHSITGTITNSLKLAFLLLGISSLNRTKDLIDLKVIKWIQKCYYASIIVGIIILLGYKGVDVYREGGTQGGVLLPPVYFIYFAILMAMYNFQNILKGKKRVQNTVLLLINVMFVYFTRYLTQLLFLVIGLLIILIFIKVKSKYASTIFLAICIILPFVFSGLTVSLLGVINNTIFSEIPVFHSRINEIIAVLNGTSTSSMDFIERIELQKMSWEVFLKNPIIGIPFNQFNVNSIIVGGHCEWLDDLAKFGVIGSALYIGFLSRFFNVVRNRLKLLSAWKRSTMLLFIVYGFFNPFLTNYFLCGYYFISKIDECANEEIQESRG
jgi:hypothetical protein